MSCLASPRSVGQDIGSPPWLYWELGCPHTAAVRRPSSSQMRSVLPQAVINSIFPSSWSHWLFPRFRRSTQFVWFFTAGYPVISSHHLLMALFLTNSLWMLWMVRCKSLACLCCIRPHSPCISRGYDFQRILILYWVATPIICYHLHVNYVCSYSHLPCLHCTLAEWRWVGVPGWLDQTVRRNRPPPLSSFSLPVSASQ